MAKSPERKNKMKNRKFENAYETVSNRNNTTRYAELRKDEREGMPYMEAYAKYPEMRDMVDRLYERD